MTLKTLPHSFSICKAAETAAIDLSIAFCFVGRTDEEISIVCPTEEVPPKTLERDDGWRGFRIEGTLDFSLTGILAKLSGILTDKRIGLFAVSTFNTDYVFVKEDNFAAALEALAAAGYDIVWPGGPMSP